MRNAFELSWDGGGGKWDINSVRFMQVPLNVVSPGIASHSPAPAPAPPSTGTHLIKIQIDTLNYLTPDNYQPSTWNGFINVEMFDI